MTTIVQAAMTAVVPVPDLSAVETQIAVQNLRSVINNNSSYIRAVDGIADEFGNQGGVSIDVDGTTDATDTHSTHISESGTVSAHSESSISPAWEALDDVIGSDNNMWQPLVQNGSGWFQYAWSSPKRLVTYKIQCRNHRNGSPNAWTMQGSNTGEFAGEEVTLDTVSGVDMVANTNYSYTCDVSTTKYAYHRMVITQCTVNEGPQFQGIEYFVGAETGDSINITYDGTGDYYTTLGPDVDQVPTMTSNSAPSGTASASSENTTAQQAWKVFNDATGDAWYGATAGTGWIKYDFGSGVTKTPVAIKIQASPSPTGAPASGTIQGSNDGSTWTTIKTLSGLSWTANEIKTFTISSTTAYRYFFFYIVPASGGPSLGEIQILEAGYDAAVNMTLISETFTAETAPSESSAVFLHQPVDSVTLNTDILGYISRDAGTTWTQGTIVDAGSFDSTINILTMNAVDISGQPSGTSMKYKIVTANTKEQRLHGAWLAWS